MIDKGERERGEHSYPVKRELKGEKKMFFLSPEFLIPYHLTMKKISQVNLENKESKKIQETES